MSQPKKTFLELRIEDLKGVIEHLSWNVDRESVRIVDAARKNLREAEIQLQMLVEEEDRFASIRETDVLDANPKNDNQ